MHNPGVMQSCPANASREGARAQVRIPHQMARMYASDRAHTIRVRVPGWRGWHRTGGLPVDAILPGHLERDQGGGSSVGRQGSPLATQYRTFVPSCQEGDIADITSEEAHCGDRANRHAGLRSPVSQFVVVVVAGGARPRPGLLQRRSLLPAQRAPCYGHRALRWFHQRSGRHARLALLWFDRLGHLRL